MWLPRRPHGIHRPAEERLQWPAREERPPRADAEVAHEGKRIHIVDCPAPFAAGARRYESGTRPGVNRLVLPDALRYLPGYHQARLRVALAEGKPLPWDSRLVNRLDHVVDLPLSLKPITIPDLA